MRTSHREDRHNVFQIITKQDFMTYMHRIKWQIMDSSITEASLGFSKINVGFSNVTGYNHGSCSEGERGHLKIVIKT